MNEVKKYLEDKNNAEKRLKKANEELDILTSRVDSMKGEVEPNGIYFFVSEEITFQSK